jgi:hypothetical protein
MMSEKIPFEFMSPIAGLTLVEECRIQPSINYIPDSWKKLPQAVDMPLEDINPWDIGKYFGSGVPSTTAKGCPSFIDIFHHAIYIFGMTKYQEIIDGKLP